MTLETALAIFLYLKDTLNRSEHEAKMFAAAWGVICQAAEFVLKE